MLRIFLSIIICSSLFACDEVLNNNSAHTGKARRKITYSYSCLDSAVGGSSISKNIDRASDLVRNIAFRKDEVTDSAQNQWGDAFHQDAIESKAFVLLNDANINATLQKTLNDLLAVRDQPSSIKYSIYALDDTAINAFTFGGHIYVTKAMYDRCKNNPSSLYAIVGHEIGHSEKGHTKKTIEEMIMANEIFGEKNGAAAFQIKKLLTSSFNQKNELEADYYGVDLVDQLGDDVCAAVQFWKEMSKTENKYNKVEDFLRTHPFSSLRAECLENHIRTNYHKDCSAVK